MGIITVVLKVLVVVEVMRALNGYDPPTLGLLKFSIINFGQLVVHDIQSIRLTVTFK